MTIIHARNSHQNGYVHPKGWEYSPFWVCEFVDDLLVIYLFIYLFICWFCWMKKDATTATTTTRRSNPGAVAGGLSLGAMLLVALFALSLLWWRRRRNKQVFFDVNGKLIISYQTHCELFIYLFIYEAFSHMEKKN